MKHLPLNPRLWDPDLGAMNFLNEIREHYPQAISFAAGRPYEGFFRTAEAVARIPSFAEGRLDAFAQYGATNGLIGEDLAKHLRVDEQIEVAPESILVTVGCQEAIVICLAGLFDPARDVLLVADPSYIGVTGVAKLLGIEIVPVRSGETGLDLHDLREKALSVRARGKHARAIYDVPDFCNPSGATLPLAQRHQLLALAEELDFVVLEDATYRLFAYDGAPPPSLKALDTKQNVIYLGTFAKSIFPGARVGFLVADQTVQAPDGTTQPLTAHLSKIKSMLTVNTPPVNQALVAALLRAHGHSLRAYNEPAIAFYRHNRDCLLEALAEAFPPDSGIHWNQPGGGFFLSLTLPWEVDDEKLRISAGRYGVIWVPMRQFHLAPGGTKQMRLSFSYVSADQIREGVRRLAHFVREELAR